MELSLPRSPSGRFSRNMRPAPKHVHGKIPDLPISKLITPKFLLIIDEINRAQHRQSLRRTHYPHRRRQSKRLGQPNELVTSPSPTPNKNSRRPTQPLHPQHAQHRRPLHRTTRPRPTPTLLFLPMTPDYSLFTENSPHTSPALTSPRLLKPSTNPSPASSIKTIRSATPTSSSMPVRPRRIRPTQTLHFAFTYKSSPPPVATTTTPSSAPLSAQTQPCPPAYTPHRPRQLEAPTA